MGFVHSCSLWTCHTWMHSLVSSHYISPHKTMMQSSHARHFNTLPFHSTRGMFLFSPFPLWDLFVLVLIFIVLFCVFLRRKQNHNLTENPLMSETEAVECHWVEPLASMRETLVSNPSTETGEREREKIRFLWCCVGFLALTIQSLFILNDFSTLYSPWPNKQNAWKLFWRMSPTSV